MADILVITWLVVALVFAVIQWIDNENTYYLGGPPSGLLIGLTWPIWMTVALIFGLIAGFSAIQRRWKKRPGGESGT